MSHNHWSQITTTNIIIKKKFAKLQPLPKCDTDTQSKQMLLEKWANRLLGTNLQSVKSTMCANHNKAIKQSKPVVPIIYVKIQKLNMSCQKSQSS